MAEEVELKFILEPAAVADVESHPLWQRLENRRTERTLSTYYDTPTHALRGERIALRLRERDGSWTQTVKTPGPPGREHVRGEWEHPRPAPRLDLDLVDDEGVRDRLWDAAGAEGLMPVFTTDFERTRGELARRDGVVEVALDRGEVRAGDASEPLCELEFELKEGHPRILFDVARRFLRKAPLRLEPRSKAERGYGLGDDDPRRWSKAPVPELRAKMTTADAFRAIARSCLAHLLAHERCALDGRELEGVHQMRVACRRLRSIISLLKRYLPPPARELAQELRWFAGELGPARQWDVFLDETLEPLKRTLPHEASLDALEERARGAQERGYRRVRKAIRSRRYTRMLVDLLGWLEEDFGERAGRPLGTVAKKVLDKRYRRVLSAGDRRHELTDEELHDLRIEVKKLRYAAAFFQGLYPKRRQARFTAVFKRLQDALGRIQDVADAPTVLGALRRSRPVERAKGVVMGHHAAIRAQALADLERPLEELSDLKPYWD